MTSFIYFKTNNPKPIFSYIKINNKKITDIEEKKLISYNANSGAYFFSTVEILYNYIKKTLKSIMYTLVVHLVLTLKIKLHYKKNTVKKILIVQKKIKLIRLVKLWILTTFALSMEPQA
jgi:hypothetical protein